MRSPVGLLARMACGVRSGCLQSDASARLRTLPSQELAAPSDRPFSRRVRNNHAHSGVSARDSHPVSLLSTGGSPLPKARPRRHSGAARGVLPTS